MERLRWAALLHDVSRLAVPGDLAHREEALTPEERQEAARHRTVVDGVLGEVDFLRPMVDISAAAHSLLGLEEIVTAVAREARILAAADLFDARTSTRSYREAMTQAEAFASLRAEEWRFGAEVLDALEAAVVGRGEVYGSPDEASARVLEQQVRERAIRA
jgi:HD-GYP domain-containing protein (c-di-GMP phosphodiesterase class II)